MLLIKNKNKNATQSTSLSTTSKTNIIQEFNNHDESIKNHKRKISRVF